ncbi:MAG: hypothetical protein SF051_15755 [Elusimicrobiota bacterium]|nr:hypothetical protein [Elusimicrobiota bacterium]
MKVPDYHPIEAGRRLEYELRRAGGVWTLVVDCLEATRQGDRVAGKLRRTWRGPDGEQTSTETVERRPDGVYHAGRLVLPHPPVRGRSWDHPPRQYRLEGLDGAVEVPAGAYKGCARVSYLIAGGDAGSGERLYAPGVGLVHEACREEADPYETRLLRIGRIPA